MKTIKATSLFALSYRVAMLLLFMLSNAYAQKQGQEKIDSIAAYIKSNEAADTNRVNSLCEIAFTYCNINPEKGVSYGKEALKLAEELNFISGQAKANRFIGVNYYGLSEYTEAIHYYKKALDAEKKAGNKKGVGSNLMNIGLIYTSQSDYSKALDYYFKSLRLFEDIQFQKGLAACYGNIVLVYMETGDHDKALDFAFKAFSIDKEMGNETGQARHLGNIGVLFIHKKDLEKAQKYLNDALVRYKKVGDERGVANVIGNIAGLYIKNKNFDTAIEYILQSIDSYEKINSKRDVAVNTLNLSSAYIEMHKSKIPSQLSNKTANKLDVAKGYTLKALAISQELKETYIARDARHQLYEIEKLKGNKEAALAEYEKFVALRDTISGQETKKDLLRKEVLFEFEKKAVEDSIKNASEKQIQQAQIEAQQANLEVEKTKRNGLIVGIILAIIVLLFIANRLRITRRQKEFIEKQKEEVIIQKEEAEKQKLRSDELLLNILPFEVAEELKMKGESKAKNYKDATVMFTDFKDFTQLSEKLTPKELVSEINECFSAFDHIMTKHGVEKIKTIGDAYMAAGGLPTANKTHAEDVVKAALDIQQFMHTHKEKKLAANELFFEIRIGVHTGPVVAGIVGVKKFAYDIWGDTVNTASRMESSGEVGKVNISGTTYELVKDKFTCVHRGKVQAKGKGEIDMYFVS